MNFITRHINAIGILMLTTFAVAAAGLYWNLPQRLQRTARPAPVTARLTCPMHPEVTSDRPGNCPKCGMALVFAKTSTDMHTGCTHSVAEGGCCGTPAFHNVTLTGHGCTRSNQITSSAEPPNSTR